MMITLKHPVRAAVADLPVYYNSIGCALHAVHAACADHGIDADPEFGNTDFAGPKGRVNLRLKPANDECVVCDRCAEKIDDAYYGNVVVFVWYTMPSGRIELTTYVS